MEFRLGSMELGIGALGVRLTRDGLDGAQNWSLQGKGVRSRRLDVLILKVGGGVVRIALPPSPIGLQSMQTRLRIRHSGPLLLASVAEDRLTWTRLRIAVDRHICPSRHSVLCCVINIRFPCLPNPSESCRSIPLETS